MTLMKIKFRNLPHYLDNIFSSGPESSVFSLPVLGKPLIIRNIAKILSRYKKMNNIMLPSGLGQTTSIVQTNFPSISVDEYNEEKNIDAGNASGSTERNLTLQTVSGEEHIEVPLLSYLREGPKGELLSNRIVYPWDFLRVIQFVLELEVTKNKISSDVTIGKTSIINGPCVMEDGVTIDDFCKIKGPIFFGKKTKIGAHSLIVSSMIGEDSVIGFNNEITRSYLAARNKVSHQNTILDSIVAEECHFSSYIGTSNTFFDTTKTIRYKIGEEFVDTGLRRFGAVVGYGTKIASKCEIFPGRYIPPNTYINAGTIVTGTIKQKQD